MINASSVTDQAPGQGPPSGDKPPPPLLHLPASDPPRFVIVHFAVALLDHSCLCAWQLPQPWTYIYIYTHTHTPSIAFRHLPPNSARFSYAFLSCCLTSTEAGWPIRDGDRVGRGRESDWLDRGNRPKKTGETVDRRQNNGSVKAVSPRHCPATCALCNCSFNCCAGQSH